MHYLLGAKPGDHQYLFDQVIEEMNQDNHRTETHQVASATKKIRTETSYVAGVSLNKSHADVRVNFLQHHEFDCNEDAVTKRFSWVTDIDLSQKSLHEYQKAGRCRWRVENETFNTLKNQGYALEHNYGHGDQNLSTVLALLMFLAFTVDQIQEACCGLFGAAMQRTGRRIRLWESIRSHLRHFEFESFADLFTAIALARLCKPPPAL